MKRIYTLSILLLITLAATDRSSAQNTNRDTVQTSAQTSDSDEVQTSAENTGRTDLQDKVQSTARKVYGTVLDTDNNPVAGAFILVEGSDGIGTSADLDGKYELYIPSANTSTKLTASCMGYISQTIALGQRDSVNFRLTDDSKQLEEVVVVGYGSMRKSDLTGSLSSVKIDEGNAAKSATLDKLLQGNAAGVQVTANNASPDAGVNIRIRGIGSFNGSNEPLYVVDGIIINGSSQSVTTITQGADSAGSDEATNGLAGLNPQDIERVEILKDASATAIYGSQGANGVVLITTKSAKSEKLSVQASVGVDVSTRYKTIDMLSFEEYLNYADALYAAGGVTETQMKSLWARLYEDPVNKEGLKVSPVNWQDYMTRTAVNQRYYASVAGRPKNMSYRFSMGYSNRQGIVKKTDAEQYTMKLNLFRYITPKFKVGTSMNLAYLKSNLAQGAVTSRIAASSSIMRSMLMTRPYITTEEMDDDESEVAGPDKWLNDFVNRKNQYRIIPSIYGEYKILKWLSFKSTFGGEWSASEYTKFKSIRISTTTGNISAIAHNEWSKYNWDNMFLFDKRFGSHSISGTLGMTMSKSSSSNQTVQGWGVGEFMGQEGTINANPNADQTYYEESSSLMSGLARAVYSYDNRYVLTGTFRVDGSSKFKGANKWCCFPSFAFAWNINKEPWYNAQRILTESKVRLGWGRVGNQAIANYQTMSPYSNFRWGDQSFDGVGYEVGIAPSIIANSKLKWETTEQFNAGIDLSFLYGRVSFSADIYHKMTKDLLQQKTIAYSSGFTTMYMNQGSIRNMGLELTLDATAISTRDWTWNISGNISFNKNRIIKIGDAGESGSIYMAPGDERNVNYFYGAPMTSSGTNMGALNIFIEGQPMGLFYAFKTDGIVQQGETGPGFAPGETVGEGSIKYVDVNGNGYIDDLDRTIVGDPNPLFTYGFSTSLTWKRLTLTANFNGVYGNSVYNLNNNSEFKTNQINYNVRRQAVTDAWSVDNPDGRYPALGKTTATDTRFLDICIEDGSFLRLSNLSLSYDIPLGKSKILKALNVSLSGGNLLVLSKYSGWDPEVSSFGSSTRRMGIDFNSYPSARTFSFDLKFTF